MGRFAILGSTALLALFVGAPAAFGQTAEEAATIRSIIASVIDGFGDGREVRGEIAVTSGAGRYDVAIPEINIASFQTGRPWSLTIAPISGTITPAANDVYTVALALPSTVTHGEVDRGTTVATGTGMLSFTFSAVTGIPSAVAVTIDGLAVATAESGSAIRLGSFAVKARTVDSALGPNLDDVLISIGAKGMNLAVGDGDQQGALGGATLQLAATGLDVPAIVSTVHKAEALFDQAKTASSSEIGGVLTEAIRAFGELPKLIDGFRVGTAVEGLDLATPSGPLAIGSTGFGLDVSGLSGEATTVAITAGLEDLVAPVSDESVYPPYVPKHAALDVALTGIPNGLIAATVSGALSTALAAGEDDLGDALVQSLLTVLMTSDLTFEVRTLEATSPAASLSASGSVAPEPLSRLMAGGSATIVVGGFEAAIATALDYGGGLQMAQGLTVIQAFGTPTIDADGNPARRYEIAAGTDGKLLVNGIDIVPLLAGI